MNFKPFGCPGVANRFDYDFVSFQGNSLPVSCDVAKESVLDLVPFARSRRIVTNLDHQTRLVGKTLKLQFPQPIAGTVAAATVRGDYQPFGFAVAFPAQLLPPTFDAGYRKLGGVVADADRHAGFVAVDVVNAVGHGFAF